MFVRPIRAGERGTGFIARCHLEGASDGEGSSWRRGRRRRGDETPSRRAKPPGWRPRKWCVAFPVDPPETRARTARHIRSEPNDENTSPLAPLTRALFPASPSTQNAELFTLTYGAIVRQVLHDYEDCVEEANKKLDAMGHSIGCRLVEDFLAKTNVQRCGDFRDVADAVAKGLMAPKAPGRREATALDAQIPASVDAVVRFLEAAPRTRGTDAARAGVLGRGRQRRARGDIGAGGGCQASTRR